MFVFCSLGGFYFFLDEAISKEVKRSGCNRTSARYSAYSCGLNEIEVRKKCHFNRIGRYLYNVPNDTLGQESTDSTHFVGGDYLSA